jgi:Ca2+-binding RTX toxin-like protein
MASPRFTALTRSRAGGGSGPPARAARAAIGAVLALTALLALPGSALALEQKLIASDGAEFAQAGNSVAVDGNTLVVGAPGDAAGAGAAYVFTRSASTWTQVAKLTASDAAVGVGFGSSVAIDGDTIVVGAPLSSVGTTLASGAAYVFTGGGASWTQTSKLIASDRDVGDHLGVAVALDADAIVVGASFEGTDLVFQRGAAYVYARSGSGARTEAVKLTPDDGAESDFFASSLAIDRGTIVIGAPVSLGTQGSAYVFTGAGASWTQSAKLTASDGGPGDFFGAVDIDGDTIVVGAPGALNVGLLSPAGAVYVFTGAGASWAQTGKLIATDAGDGDELGSSVAIDGATIVAGAQFDDAPNIDQGSLYTFTRTGPAVRTQSGKLVDSSGGAGDRLGASAAISGTTIVGGAPRDDVGDNDAQGSAVVFFAEDNQPPVAVDDVYSVIGGGVLNAPAPGVLGNDSDPDGDPLTAQVVSPPASGTLSLNPDGSLTYTPGEDTVGSVTFTYQASDGTATSNIATVTITVAAGCDGVAATRVGTAGSNVLTGTGGNDVIVGLGGNDTIDAGSGNDRVCGGSGNDTIDAGSGTDRVFAGSGNDAITAGSGDDTVYGGAGDDRLDGGGDRDRLFGEAGIDRLFGGGDPDQLDGGADTPDRCDGEGGADTATACEQTVNVP